jgi:hypothetical protein
MLKSRHRTKGFQVQDTVETKDQIQGQGDTERPDMGYSGDWGPDKGFKRVQGVMIQGILRTRERIQRVLWTRYIIPGVIVQDTADTGGYSKGRP